MKTIKYLLSFLCVLFLLQVSGQTIVYVRSTAAGSNNGSSWTNAYTNLKTALANAPSGAQVWVSGGTYYVPSGSARSSAFDITNKSLSVYGGFSPSGSPGSLSQRSIKLYPTILSGDIGQNDSAFKSSTRKEDADRADNAYAVINISLSGASSYSIVFDGLTIQDGNSNGTSDGTSKWGAGIFHHRTANGSGTHSLYVRNCVIRNNTAIASAGIASYLYYVNNGTVNWYIETSQFYNNTADEWAVMNMHTPNSSGLTLFGWKIFSCLFHHNQALNNNSGLFGALCSNNYNASSAFTYTFHWNTFADNNIGNGGGLICTEGSSVNNVQQGEICNNIFWSNQAARTVYKRAGALGLIQGIRNAFNILEAADSFLSADPEFGNLWVNPRLGGASNPYSLSPCSPAINSGNTNIPFGGGSGSFTVPPTTTDVSGNTRTVGSSIDRGAFEFAGSSAGPSSASINMSICQGSTYLFKGQNLSTAGTYYDTLVNAVGCDSVVTLNLNLKSSSHDTLPVLICAGDSFSFNQVKYGAAGYYSASYVNTNGCDSTVTIDLKLHPKPQPVIVRNGAELAVNGGPFDTYQWYLNGNTINGATSSTHTPASNGNYSVMVSKNTGSLSCSAGSDDYAVGFVGLPETDALRAFRFYPNPATSQVVLESRTGMDIQVINLLGELVLQSKVNGKASLMLQDLPRGIYVLRSSSGLLLGKLMLQ